MILKANKVGALVGTTSGVAQTLIARNTLSGREQEEQRASEKIQDSRLFNLVLCKWILVKICSELQGWQDEKLACSLPPAASYTSIYPFIMHQLCVLFSYIKRNAWPCLNILEQTFGICLFGLFFFSVQLKIKRWRESFKYCVIIVSRRVHKIFRLMRLLPGTLRGSLLACLASEKHVNNLI